MNSLVYILFLGLILTSIGLGRSLNKNPQKNITPTVNQVTTTATIAGVIDYVVISETPIPSASPSKPPPTPTITIAKQIDANLDNLMEKYAQIQSVDKNLLKKIALCESRLNPNAVNGPYAGLYQFTKQAWQSARSAMNLDADPDLRFNAEEAIKTAAYKIALGQISIWPNCK